MKFKGIGIFVLTAAVAFMPSLASAAEYVWDNGGGDTNWSNNENWVNDIGPVSGADTIIQISETSIQNMEITESKIFYFDNAAVTINENISTKVLRSITLGDAVYDSITIAADKQLTLNRGNSDGVTSLFDGSITGASQDESILKIDGQNDFTNPDVEFQNGKLLNLELKMDNFARAKCLKDFNIWWSKIELRNSSVLTVYGDDTPGHPEETEADLAAAAVTIVAPDADNNIGSSLLVLKEHVKWTNGSLTSGGVVLNEGDIESVVITIEGTDTFEADFFHYKDAKISNSKMTIKKMGKFYNFGEVEYTLSEDTNKTVSLSGEWVSWKGDFSQNKTGLISNRRTGSIDGYNFKIESGGTLTNYGTIKNATITVEPGGWYGLGRHANMDTVELVAKTSTADDPVTEATALVAVTGTHKFESYHFESGSVISLAVTFDNQQEFQKAQIEATADSQIKDGTFVMISPWNEHENSETEDPNRIKDKFIWKPMTQEFIFATGDATLTKDGSNPVDPNSLTAIPRNFDYNRFFALKLLDAGAAGTTSDDKYIILSLADDNKSLKARFELERIATYSGSAITKRSKQVGKALDASYTTGFTNELYDVLEFLDGTPNNEHLDDYLSQLSPAQVNFGHYNARVSSLTASRNLSTFLSNRRLALKGKRYKVALDPINSGLAYADNPAIASNPLAQILPRTPGERESDREVGMDKMVSIYGRATTGYTRVGSSSGRIGLRSSSVGALFGFDVRVHENVVVGFAGSYDYSDVNFSNHLGGGQVNSYRFGPYALVYSGDWFFETEATIGLHDNKFGRRVGFMGATAKSNYDAIDFTLNVGGGYDFHVAGLTVTPRLNVQYQFYHAGGFEEKQAAGANLRVARYETSALSSRLGVELWKRFEFESDMMHAATPFFNIGWRREWLAPTDLTSQFVGGGDSFNIDNDLFSRNAIYLGIGSTFELTDSLNMDLRYQADLGDRENTQQNASINLRYRF